jgi:hypothetical protein
LLPPVFCAASADAMAGAVRHLRTALGLEVLPENPPGHALVGDLHPLAYFARVAERADCGLLLDVSHLAILQKALGRSPTFGLDAFPLERVVEVHVAGGTEFRSGRRTLIDDDHGPAIHDDTWRILDAVLPRLTALRAVVVECERNPPEVVRRLIGEVRRRVAGAPGLHAGPVPPPSVALPEAEPVDHRGVQRALFRMQLDPSALHPQPSRWLADLDRDLVHADPGGRRRDQLLGNVGLEFVHTLRVAPELLAGFPASAELHAAITNDERFVLAFARYAATRVSTPLARALLALDAALAEIRRAPAETFVGFVRRADDTRLVVLPAGTVAAATALRTSGVATPLGEGTETALVRITRAGPHRLPDLDVEVLPQGLAALLAALPLDAAGLAAFGAAHDLARAELDEIVRGLAADRLLAVEET